MCYMCKGSVGIKTSATFLANPSQITKFWGHLWVWLIQFHMLSMVTTIVVSSVYLGRL